jgi:hypothetical protein
MNTSYDFQPHMWAVATVTGIGTSNDFKVTGSVPSSQITSVDWSNVTEDVKQKHGQCIAGTGLTLEKPTCFNIWESSDTDEKPYQHFSADLRDSITVTGQEALQKLIDEVTVRINANRAAGVTAEHCMLMPCTALLGND